MKINAIHSKKNTGSSKEQKRLIKIKPNTSPSKTKHGGAIGYLTLGWRVTSSLAPKYWLSTEAKAGGQSAEDLMRVPAKTIARHTAIVAQSGSGKSFF